VSVEEEPTINVYPNPTTQWAPINGITAEYQLRVVDLKGAMLFQKTIYSDTSIDLSDWQQGIYILQFVNTTTQAIHTKKLIKR